MRDGLTEAQVCTNLGVSVATLNKFKKQHVELAKALKKGRGIAVTEVDCTRVSQEFGSMSQPMNLVEADLKSKLINYNDDPIDKMCLENTAMEMNSKADIRPVKVQGKDDNKIDGAVTMIIAYLYDSLYGHNPYPKDVFVQ